MTNKVLIVMMFVADTQAASGISVYSIGLKKRWLFLFVSASRT